MANITYGPGTKKEETVYSGPAPQTNQGTVYNGPTPATAGGTVYGGPAPKAGGTVYGGPNGTAYPGPGSSPGTVYNPRQTAAQQQAVPGGHSEATKAAGIFFLIAGFSVINTLLILAHSPLVLTIGLAVTRISPTAPIEAIAVINVIAVGAMVLLGLFVRQGSKAALVIGMVLYAGDTALLFLDGNAAVHVLSIFVHGIFLIGMFNAFRQMER
jgi:hypothetical protein